MLLRRSGEQDAREFALEGITATGVTVGVPAEDALQRLADAVFAADPEAMASARDKALDVLAEQTVVDAIGVAAGFNGITRIANGTGLPLDAATETQTVAMRDRTGIEAYSEAAKQERWG